MYGGVREGLALGATSCCRFEDAGHCHSKRDRHNNAKSKTTNCRPREMRLGYGCDRNNSWSLRAIPAAIPEAVMLLGPVAIDPPAPHGAESTFHPNCPD